MLLIVAMAIFMPCSNLIVQASAYIQPITLTTTEDGGSGVESGGTAESGNAGSSGESGSTAESGGSATEDEVPPTTFDGFAISTSIITDSYLYDALLDIYKSVDTTYKGSTIYSDMFNSEEFTEINLDNKNISSLEGLNKLDLDYLETFSANLNNISSFDENVFVNTNVDVFKNLSLASNQISTFEINGITGQEGAGLTGLQNINLSSNKLSYLDLSKIEASVQDTEFTLNVAGNNFTSMSSIVLPTKRIGHVNINIINNQITEISEDYFTDKYTLNIGIQGFKLVENKYCVDTLTNVVIYKVNIPNIRVDIYKIDGESDELVASVRDADITSNFLRLALGVGEYECEYMLDSENESAYSKYDSDRTYLGAKRFSVIPQKASYVYIFKDEEYKELNKVTGEVTVKLSSTEDAIIMYQVNGGEWVEGDTIVCDQGGTYSIKAKVVIDGVESEVENIWVRTSLNLYIPDGLMLVLILLLVLALFLVVLPIISRKYFKRD